MTPIARTLAPFLLALASFAATADDTPPPAPVSHFLTLEGQATYRQRSALPIDAVFHLVARDGHRVLTELDVPLQGQQVPIPFSATVDRDLIGPKSRITLEGRIVQGKRTLFAGTAPAQHEGTTLLLAPPPRKAK